jgi:hypothetical protein
MVETCNQHNGNTQCKSMSHPICSKLAMKLPTTPFTASTHGHASSHHASTTNNIQHTYPSSEITYPQNLMFHHLSFFHPHFASIKTQPTFINPHSIHTKTRSNPNHSPTIIMLSQTTYSAPRETPKNATRSNLHHISPLQPYHPCKT